MPKVYFNDIGLKNSLLNNFQTPLIRSDRGELWENIYFRYLLDHHSSMIFIIGGQRMTMK